MTDDELAAAYMAGASPRELADAEGSSVESVFLRLSIRDDVTIRPRPGSQLRPRSDKETLKWLTEKLFEMERENKALKEEIARLKGESP